MFFANVFLLLLQASFLQLATLQPVDTASPTPLDPTGLQRARTANAVGEIFSTFAGGVWIARMALIALLAVYLWRFSHPRPGRDPRLLAALLGGLGVLLTISLSAHAAFVPETFGRAAVAVLVDWSHLAAMSLWLGGLLPLLLALRNGGRDTGGPAEAALVLHRFSALALVSVAYLAFSGFASSFFEVGDPALLVRTAYGVTLSVKLTLVGVLVLLGALNRFVLIPRVRETGLAGGFSRSLPVEIGFGLLLLFSVACSPARAQPPQRGRPTRPSASPNRNKSGTHHSCCGSLREKRARTPWRSTLRTSEPGPGASRPPRRSRCWARPRGRSGPPSA